MSKTEEKQIEFTCPMTREQAEQIYNLGPEAVVFVLMELAKRVAAQKAASLSPYYVQAGAATGEPTLRRSCCLSTAPSRFEATTP